jgi:hypothetical protein
MTMCKAAVAVVGSLGIGAAITVSAKSDLGRLRQPHASRSFEGRTTWLVIAVFDCATEIALTAMVAGLVSGLQMTLRKKIGVCSAFAWRLGLVTRFCHLRQLLTAIQAYCHGSPPLPFIREHDRLGEHERCHF